MLFLKQLAFSLSAEAASRLSCHYGAPVSAVTFVALIRKEVILPADTPAVRSRIYNPLAALILLYTVSMMVPFLWRIRIMTMKLFRLLNRVCLIHGGPLIWLGNESK